MSDLAVVQPGGALAVQDELADLERTLGLFERMGASGLFPSEVKTPGDALVLAAAGRKLGFDPLTAVRAFHIVKGQTTLKADVMRGVVIRFVEAAGGVFRFVETSRDRAVLEVSRRPGDPVLRLAMTIQEATAAGLTSSTWKNFPAEMLVAALTRRAGRLLFPDVLAGIYTPDELGGEDAPPPLAQPVAVAPVDARPAEARRQPAPVEDVEDAEVHDEAPAIHPRLAQLLPAVGGDLEALCWYLACRDTQPSEAATVEAATAWVASRSDRAWARTVEGMIPALQRRMALVGDAPDYWIRYNVFPGSKAHKALGVAEERGLDVWDLPGAKGAALAVADLPLMGPGHKALDAQLEALADLWGRHISLAQEDVAGCLGWDYIAQVPDAVAGEASDVLRRALDVGDPSQDDVLAMLGDLATGAGR